MNKVALFFAAAAVLVPLRPASAQANRYPLESASGLRLHNVAAEPAVLDGKKGVRLTISEDAARRAATMTPEQQALFEQLAVVEGLEFANGVIEVEIAGIPAPGAGAGARGFVGIAFRLKDDMRTYDAFYLRPTNGRVEDQERRNHAAQYISHPDWTWFRLRQESPSKYESYVDLVPGVWTRVKIEVRGDRARLYVHGQEQPTLVVNDVKTGASAKGAVALWIGPGTVAHFRNLTVGEAKALEKRKGRWKSAAHFPAHFQRRSSAFSVCGDGVFELERRQTNGDSTDHRYARDEPIRLAPRAAADRDAVRRTGDDR